MNKVRAGEPLRIRAADWNRIVDTVNASREHARSQGAAPITGTVPTSVVDVLNAGTETIRGFNVIGLAANNAIDTGEPETNLPTRNIYFTATEASEDTNCILAITQENIEPGEIGKALVSGVTLAQFLDAYNDEDESCTFADVNPASSRCLRRVPGGRIRLLTPKFNAALSGLALVLLGATASSGAAGAIEPFTVRIDASSSRIALEVYSPTARCASAVKGEKINAIWRERTTAYADLWCQIFYMATATFVSNGFGNGKVQLLLTNMEINPETGALNDAEASYSIVLVNDTGSLAYIVGGPSWIAFTPNESDWLVDIAQLSYDATTKTFAVQQINAGALSVDYVAGDQSLFVEEAPSSTNPDGILRRVTALSELSAESVVKWCVEAMPVASFGQNAFAAAHLYSPERILSRCAWQTIDAVLHAQLHYSNFIPAE